MSKEQQKAGMEPGVVKGKKHGMIKMPAVKTVKPKKAAVKLPKAKNILKG